MTAPANWSDCLRKCDALSANASDNVGVVGVQFLVNGTTAGS